MRHNGRRRGSTALTGGCDLLAQGLGASALPVPLSVPPTWTRDAGLVRPGTDSRDLTQVVRVRDNHHHHDGKSRSKSRSRSTSQGSLSIPSLALIARSSQV